MSYRAFGEDVLYARPTLLLNQQPTEVQAQLVANEGALLSRTGFTADQVKTLQTRINEMLFITGHATIAVNGYLDRVVCGAVEEINSWLAENAGRMPASAYPYIEGWMNLMAMLGSGIAAECGKLMPPFPRPPVRTTQGVFAAPGTQTVADVIGASVQASAPTTLIGPAASSPMTLTYQGPTATTSAVAPSPSATETLEQALIRRAGYTCSQLQLSCLPASRLPQYAGCFTGDPPAGVTKATFDAWCLKMLECGIHNTPPCDDVEVGIAASFPLPTCLSPEQVATVAYCNASGWWGTNKLGNAMCWMLSKAPGYWALLSAIPPCGGAALPSPGTAMPPPAPDTPAPPATPPMDETAVAFPPGAGEETIDEEVFVGEEMPPGPPPGRKRLMTMGIIGAVGLAAIAAVAISRRRRK